MPRGPRIGTSCVSPRFLLQSQPIEHLESARPAKFRGLFLREKELRIALVCFGGVSLAVYMHGICKEILKLLRASSALHRITDRSLRAKASFFDQADSNDPEYDTEADYFELLREIGRK